ncbi:hypothetical protein [Methylobacterium sp. 10]|uniref:hypothetical protein n=1 Tax=Methylobacterium sp. 10 TaxID=1101191 RepID=UPI0012DBCFC0|nr:hypothetical protein [Methylobacterium sp. 10]
MIATRLLSITLPLNAANALDEAAGKAGMTASSFLAEQVAHAFGTEAYLSKRDQGRKRRRATRAQRKAFALARRASRQPAEPEPVQ